MDGTHLTTAAGRLNELADDVDEFTTTASERAAQVAQNIRDVAGELTDMANALEGTTTGTVEPTPPEGQVGVEPTSAEDEPTA